MYASNSASMRCRFGMNAPNGRGLLTLGLTVMLAMALAVAALTILYARAYAAGTVGDGTPASCTGNALQDALDGGGMVQFNCGAAAHTIIANTYVISQDTVVDGDGRITLDGEDLRQIFLVQPNVTLELRNLTLQNGNFGSGGCVYGDTDSNVKAIFTTFTGCAAMPDDGGAIFSLGTVTSDFSRFTGNSAGDDGGAIFALGDITVRDSLFVSNTADSGAAIRLNGGTLSVARALFTDNIATTTGGAIDIATGTVTVTDSTFYQNHADRGGGLYAAGASTDTSVVASTLLANRANLGGALYIDGSGGVFSLQSSIAAQSLDLAGVSEALECDGSQPITSAGYNLIGDNSCFNGEPTDIKNVDATGGVKLGPLADNGGFTQTFLPDADSPALDKIPQNVCTASDQRRGLRVAPCDIGAVERGALLPTLYLPILIQQE